MGGATEGYYGRWYHQRSLHRARLVLFSFQQQKNSYGHNLIKVTSVSSLYSLFTGIVTSVAEYNECVTLYILSSPGGVGSVASAVAYIHRYLGDVQH